MRWESCLGTQSAEVLRAVNDGQRLSNLAIVRLSTVGGYRRLKGLTDASGTVRKKPIWSRRLGLGWGGRVLRSTWFSLHCVLLWSWQRMAAAAMVHRAIRRQMIAQMAVLVRRL